MTNFRVIENDKRGLRVLRCDTSGIRIVHRKIPSERIFLAFGFATPPDDDSGKPHIIEHSVFGGNLRFPDRHTLDYINQCSMISSINATTFSNKTIYYAETSFAEDVKRVADIFLPMLLCPQFLQDPEIFEREVYKFDEFTGKFMPGIVYNEMVSTLNNPLRVLTRAAMRSIYPRHSARFESGGIPRAIAGLNLDSVCAYYQRHYRPEQLIIYLSGNCSDQDLIKSIGEIPFKRSAIDVSIRSTPQAGDWTQGLVSLDIGEMPSNENSLAFFLNFGPISASNLIAAKRLQQILKETGPLSLSRFVRDNDICKSVGIYLLQDSPDLIVFLKMNDIQKSNGDILNLWSTEFFPKLKLSIKDIMNDPSCELFATQLDLNELDLAKLAISKLADEQPLTALFRTLRAGLHHHPKFKLKFAYSMLEALERIDCRIFSVQNIGGPNLFDRAELRLQSASARPDMPPSYHAIQAKSLPYLKRGNLIQGDLRQPDVLPSDWERGTALLSTRHDPGETLWLYWKLPTLSEADNRTMDFLLASHLFLRLRDFGEINLGRVLSTVRTHLCLEVKNYQDAQSDCLQQILSIRLQSSKKLDEEDVGIIIRFLSEGYFDFKQLPAIANFIYDRLLNNFRRNPIESLIFRNLFHLAPGSIGGLGLTLKDHIRSIKEGSQTTSTVRSSLLTRRPDFIGIHTFQKRHKPLMAYLGDFFEVYPDVNCFALPRLHNTNEANKRLAYGSIQQHFHTAQSFDFSRNAKGRSAALRVLNNICFRPRVWNYFRQEGRAYGADALIHEPGILSIYSYADPRVDKSLTWHREQEHCLKDLTINEEGFNASTIAVIKERLNFEQGHLGIEQQHLRLMKDRRLQDFHAIICQYEKLRFRDVNDLWEECRASMQDPICSVSGSLENILEHSEHFTGIVTF